MQYLFDNFLTIEIVAKAFKGIKIAVGILITRAGFNLWKKGKKDGQAYFIMGASFAVMILGSIFSMKVSTIALIFIAGTGSILGYKIKQISGRGGTV